MSDPNHNLADANELPNSELPQGELHDLKRQARTNALRLKIAQQNAALAALRGQGYGDKLEGLSYNDPSNYVDLRDYLFQSPPFFGAMPTTRNDRDQGRDFPIFRTEQELAVIRGAARLITASNPIAVGVLTTLTNYVIGNGFHYAVIPRETGPGAAELATTAGAVVADFLGENNWSGDLDRELFQRSRVDGEYFLSLWHVGNGHVQARAVEPDQVTEPGNKIGIDQWLGASQQTDWTFGVHSDVDDAQAVHGFFVQWTNRDLDWNYLPGGNEPILPPDGAGSWMEHAKLNVVRSVKRGLSDFYPIQGNLEIARRVLRNMGEGSAVQAAIAWIQEVTPGVTQAQVNTGTMSRADASYTTQTQSGSRTHWLQQYDPATILKVPSGQKYLPGPLGAQHAPNFITAAEALLRSVAVRWSLPENLVTGTAENNNFASSLVAESPFVKFAESQQQFYAQRDRRTLERVLWFAWLAGRFGDVEWNAVKRSLRIEVTPPQIEVRDPAKETQVRKTLHDAGLLSRKTWSAQEGLDYEQEQKNLQQEDEAAAQADSQPSPSSRQTVKLEELADLLERFWDPAKHPRGGYPQNTGWFSPGEGSETTPNDHSVAASKGSGERVVNTGDTSAAPTGAYAAPTDGGSGKSSSPSGRRPDDEGVKQFIVPGYQERLLERDAQALAGRAADIFQNEPVEDWYIEAMKALARYRLAVGRPISEELQDKFLEYVRIQAGNAKLQREFQENLRKLRTLGSRPAGEDSELSEVVLDVTQMGLDLTGIFDPTPASDGASAIISLGRQDWSGAAMSAAGMIPILGDLAKLGKLGRYPKQLARAMALALKSEKAAALLRPILKQLEKLIECIPLEMLRDSVRAPLESLKKQLDNFFRKAEAHGHGAAEELTAQPNVQQTIAQQQQAKPRNWAQEPHSYWKSDKRVFPTQANSALTGEALKLEQKEFFKKGLLAGKDAAELRGQAATAGYTRYGGWGRADDRLANASAENALEDAIKEMLETQ